MCGIAAFFRNLLFNFFISFQHFAECTNEFFLCAVLDSFAELVTLYFKYLTTKIRLYSVYSTCM